MKLPLTDHEYQINGGAWIVCSTENTTNNGDGTYTIHDGLNADIPIGQLKVRVKAIGVNPESVALSNGVGFMRENDIDDDVLAYLAAASIDDANLYTDKGITGAKIKTSVNTLVTGLKTSELYDKIRYLWLFNGADATANCLDLKLSKSLTLHNDSTSNPTFDFNGIVLSGQNYADTRVAPSEFTDRKVSIGVYNSIASDFDYQMGLFTGSWGLGGGRGGYLAFGGSSGTDNYFWKAGLSTLNVLSDTEFTTFNKGVKHGSGTTGSGNGSGLDLTIWLGGLSNTSLRAPGNFRFAFIAEALTDEENVTLNNLVEDYSSSLLSGNTRFFTFLGDSIVAGTGANHAYSRWTTQVCKNKSYTEKNIGVSGSTIDAWVNTYAATNLTPYTSDDLGIVIALGTNDCTFNTSLTDVTNNMISLINIVTGQGWPLEKIYVNLGYYDTYSGDTISKKQTYIDAIQAACNDRGVTKVLDCQAVMVANGEDSLLSGPDNLHPNQDGHNVIAAAWVGFLS